MNTTTAKPMPETIELEAHAVYKNIGLTPRQLADQRAELIAALESILSAASLSATIRQSFGKNSPAILQARAVLDRAKAVPK